MFKIDAQLSQYSNVYGGLTLFSHLESEDDFVRCLLNSTYYYSAVCWKEFLITFSMTGTVSGEKGSLLSLLLISVQGWLKLKIRIFMFGKNTISEIL